MAISFDKALGIHQQTMLLRTQRAELLGNNIANSDTPNYKARDIDFNAMLDKALEGGKASGVAVNQTNSRHLSGFANPDLAAELLYRVPSQPSIDGNTVDVQREQSEYARNALAFQASFTFLNKKFTGLMGAIKGE